MHAQNLIARYREKPKRVVRAQIVLGGEGKAGNIGQVAQIAGMKPDLVKSGAVMGGAVGPRERCFQPFQLQRLNLIA